MRKLLVAAIFTATMILIPAGARAGFLLEASLGKGYQVSPTPRAWEQLNLEIAPGFAPSLPVLSMFHLQLGIVVDFADKSGSKTNLELRPMLSIVPPIIPLYGRLIVAVNNVFDRDTKREVAYGGALGVSIGLPGIGFLPSFGIFAEVGGLPRRRDYGIDGKKTAWVMEGRAGAYLNF